MSWQMTDWGLVDTTSRVYVDGIDDLVSWSLALHLMLDLILPGWREQQAAVRCESQASEKRGESLVGVKVRVPGPLAKAVTRLGRRLHWHNCR